MNILRIAAFFEGDTGGKPAGVAISDAELVDRAESKDVESEQ